MISLRDLEGWGAEEVCNALGISESNQRVLLHRARSKVRGALGDLCTGEGEGETVIVTSNHMACNEFVELVTEYLEGTLSPEDRQRFEEHLALCDGCSTYLEQMRQTISVLGRLPEEAIPPAAEEKLLSAFRELEDRNPLEHLLDACNVSLRAGTITADKRCMRATKQERGASRPDPQSKLIPEKESCYVFGQRFGPQAHVRVPCGSIDLRSGPVRRRPQRSLPISPGRSIRSAIRPRATKLWFLIALLTVP